MIADDRNNLKTVSEKLLSYSPVILAFFIILTPDLRIPSLPAFRLEQIFIALILLVEVIVNGFKRIKEIFHGGMSYVIVGLFFLVILTILNGSRNGYSIILNDFFELYKIYIYFGTYLVVRLNIVNETQKEKMLHSILCFTFISTLVAITQYFNFLNINELYVRALAPTQFKTLVEGYPSPRVIGITANPNYYALFASISGMIAFQTFLIKKNWKYLMATGYFFVILNMTKSRSGFLFFTIGILTLFVLISIRRIRVLYDYKSSNLAKRELLRVGFGILIIISLLILFIIIGPEALTWRLKHGLDFRNDASLMKRVERWIEYTNQFNLPKPIGIGPTKNIVLPYQVDNEWLIFLKEFGILGTIYICLVLVLPIVKSTLFRYKDIYLAVLIGGALFMITSVLISIHQVMPLIIILAALANQEVFDKEAKHL